VSVVGKLSDGYGAHTLFECSGAEGVLKGAPSLLRRGGRVVETAWP
jgi:L-iditol 2-dehydrogenase